MMAALKTPTTAPILLRRRGSSSKRYPMIPIFRKARSASILGALTLIAGLAGGAGIASAYSGEELAKTAKVTFEDARAIALKARPGTIADQELEKEKARSRMPRVRWSPGCASLCRIAGTRRCRAERAEILERDSAAGDLAQEQIRLACGDIPDRAVLVAKLKKPRSGNRAQHRNRCGKPG